jgi:hypothetical protein
MNTNDIVPWTESRLEELRKKDFLQVQPILPSKGITAYDQLRASGADLPTVEQVRVALA